MRLDNHNTHRWPLRLVNQATLFDCSGDMVAPERWSAGAQIVGFPCRNIFLMNLSQHGNSRSPFLELNGLGTVNRRDTFKSAPRP
jgi:hypothetical protein